MTDQFKTSQEGTYIVLAEDGRVVHADSDGVLAVSDCSREGFMELHQATAAATYFRAHTQVHCRVVQLRWTELFNTDPVHDPMLPEAPP